MGVFFGVLTALAWGSADFVARFAARTIGSLRTVFWMHVSGGVGLTLFLSWLGDWGHLFDRSGWKPWAWGVLAGAFNSFGMLALYRSFEVGKMAVVAPVSASYPLITLLLSLLSGERFSASRALGIGAALLGILLVAAGERSESGRAVESRKGEAAGLRWAIAASIAFGVLFWLLGNRVIPSVGALAAVWLIRVAGAALTFAALQAARIAPRLNNAKVAAQAAGTGLLDTSAFAFSNLGMKVEQVAIVSVLGSLYATVTVVLAALFLNDRVGRWQWAGIAAIFLGIALMSA
jgi:drug/metabolite transporter (DMT)-like permease